MNFDVIRKNYEISINIKRWYYNKTILLKFQEASMYDIVEFLYENDNPKFNIIERVVDFVKMYGDKKINRFDRILLYVKFDSIFEGIKKTYFNGSLDDKKQEEVVDGEISPTSANLSSYVAFLSKELKQDPLYLMKNYTTSQIKFFSDGIVWNYNEMSDEGKKANRLKSAKERAEKFDSSAIEKLLQGIDENKCKVVGE